MNIRTVNGAKNNVHLERRYSRIQNRAAAVLDAWNEYGKTVQIDVIAHMHRISINQIKKDMFGEPFDIKKKFGVKSTAKLERRLRKCLKELNEGVNRALVAVSNNVPFMLLRELEDNRNINEVATAFLTGINEKLDAIEREKNAARIDDAVEKYTKLKSLHRPPLRSVENESIVINSTLQIQESPKDARGFDGPPSPEAKTSTYGQPQTKSSSPAECYLIDDNKHYKLYNVEIEENQRVPPPNSNKLHHRTNILIESELQLKWSMTRSPGCGLENKNYLGQCKNICYMNAIIQCLSYISSFVQWLLNDYRTSHCELLANDQFCSVCILHSIICSIHGNVKNKSNLSGDVSYTSAESLAQHIEQISSTFTIGHQQDPSEFLIFLLDHLVTCLNPIESFKNINSSITQIQRIFGLELQSMLKCNICSSESIVKSWESLLSLPIVSNSSISEGLEAFFSKEELHGENLYECINCQKKVPASKTLHIINALPVIFIHLKRFNYDIRLQMTRKIHKYIAYPEILNLNCYFDQTVVELNKENDTINNYIYRLNSVVVHLGKNATSGHVFTYVRAPDTTWYKADDESISSVKLDTVLGDKNAYILCYTKVSNSSIVLSDTEMVISPLRSSSLLTSSTPIHPSKLNDKNINNNSLTNGSKRVHIYSNNCFEEHITNSNVPSTEYSSVINNTILSDHSSIQESVSPIQIESLEDNITKFNSFETSSRIEIKSSNNNNIQQQLNQILNSSNDKEKSKSCGIISPNGALNSSNLKRKQLPSPIHQYERIVSSTSQHEQPILPRFEHEQNLSSISEGDHVSLSTFQHKQPSLSTSQRVQSSLIISEDEQILSPTSEDEPFLSTTSQHEQISSSRSNNTFPSNQLNVTVSDSLATNDFIAELPSSHQFNLRSVDLAKLLVIRTEKIKKKKKRLYQQMGLLDESDSITASRKIFLSKQAKLLNSTIKKTMDSSIHIQSEKIKQSNVDVEYLYILLPYIKQLNKYCGLCVRNCTFGETNDTYRQLLRCKLHCIGHPTCLFSCSVIVQNNGTGNIIVTNRNVRHIGGVKICRPIRAPIRSLIKKRFAQGASVYRMYQEKLQKRTPEQRRGKNYDGIGKSRDILRKIKSEGVMESLLAPDVDQSLLKLLEKFQTEVNRDGKIKGAIQYISKYPCQIIVYSESSIRLFDALLKHNNVILSWDATGSIIKETNSRRLLYYELSITLPGVVNEDSIVPITFMISDAHALVNVAHWLQLFKHSYSQIFVGKPFPQPRIVLSDRAQVFLIAALRIWNNETMNDFLNRAYRIVTGSCADSDYQKTNIHACLAHVLLDSRKTINKYVPETFRDLAMWCIALLINTSTWNEFVHNWILICLVFIQLHLCDENVNKEHQDALIYKISKIKNDPNTISAIKSSEAVQDENDLFNSNVYDYSDSDDEVNLETVEHGSRSTRQKIIVDEEQEANATDSPFKSKINQVFYDALTANGISINEARDKSSRGILKWFKYLTTAFMPTLPIWSNLLLGSVLDSVAIAISIISLIIGDLTRHRRRMVRSFESIVLHNQEPRTTAISERRMGIVKRNQLGGEVHIRLDILLSILVPDMLTMVDEYWNTLLNYCSTSINNSNNSSTINIDEQRLKPIEERWRQKVSKRGLGHYAKCPDDPVVTDLLSCLLTSQTYFNENIKLPTVNPNWLNVAIGILLSVGNNDTHHHHHQFTLTSANDSSLLSVISTFLEEWRNSSASDIRSTSISFPLLNNVLNQSLEESIYILENILIPLLPCRLIINKVYQCKSCQSTIKLRCTITSIPVHVSRSGLNLERDLIDFFSPTSSDLLCSICNKSTIRHIEVLKWPQVLLININDSKKNIKHRKPPGVISLSQFSSWIGVGYPSASVYDLACFSSTLQSGGGEIMVRTTKVKKRWLTSMHKRVIGEGEQLQRLYANSRILVFERIHYHQSQFNFIHAIMRCSLNGTLTLSDSIPACATLEEACRTIETHPELIDLYNVLSSSIKTNYYCYSCQKVPDSLQKQSSQIYIFKLTRTNEIVAYPIVLKINDQNNLKEYCTYCNYSSTNVEMHVCKQVFIKCPCCLIQFVDQNFQTKDLFDSSIKLTDDKNVVHCYKPVSILLISRFSDTATVIKQEAGAYIQYNDNTYSKSMPFSNSKMADLFDTCGTTLLFYHQVHTTTAPSHMRIISQSNVNGAKRIIIQDGERRFSITTAQSNSNINQNN